MRESTYAGDREREMKGAAGEEGRKYVRAGEVEKRKGIIVYIGDRSGLLRR